MFSNALAKITTFRAQTSAKREGRYQCGQDRTQRDVDPFQLQ